MKQELVDKAIDVASRNVVQANENADVADEAKQLMVEVATLASESSVASIAPAFGIAALTAIAAQLTEISALLRAIVVHTGAALPSSDDKADLFERLYELPEDIQPLADQVDA